MNSSIDDARFRYPEILERLTIPIRQGAGSAFRVGGVLRALGARRVLLVTDPGLIAAGHAAGVRAGIEAEGIEVREFGAVRENPTTDDVDACLDAARDAAPDAIIGLGGGSSMDTAKGCNFLLSNGGRMEDYWGREKASRPMLPLIAIPTTAGTGSECQRFALIAQAATHRKMACGDVKALARLAVLDPGLTLTQPRYVTACTGLDALAHAIECAVTTAATPASLTLASESFRWLHANFPRVVRDPSDEAARAAMQWGAALAGAAIERSMLGAAHAAANPLTAHFGVTHGRAVGLALPAVIRWNAGIEAAARGYQALVRPADPDAAERGPEAAADWLAGRMETFLQLADLHAPLGTLGVEEGHIDRLAAEAAEQWTGRFNARPVARGDFARLYREMGA